MWDGRESRESPDSPYTIPSGGTSHSVSPVVRASYHMSSDTKSPSVQ